MEKHTSEETEEHREAMEADEAADMFERLACAAATEALAAETRRMYQRALGREPLPVDELIACAAWDRAERYGRSARVLRALARLFAERAPSAKHDQA
jgi:hypothetical protein